MFKKNLFGRISAFILISFLVAGCANVPGIILGTETSQPVSQPELTLTTTTEPTETVLPASPTPVPAIRLPETDQVVLTIPNSQPFSGREGDPRPDWLGWGAEAFAAAPDSSFWLADTAVSPNRLLHYSPQGELLQEVSLASEVVYAYDLAIARDSLWVLDISSQPPKVVQLSLEGQVFTHVDVDVSHGTFYTGLMACGEDTLLLTGSDGYTELIGAAGKVSYQHLQALSCYGHTYQAGSWQKAPVEIDGVQVENPPDFQAGAFLGFNPDGSFAITGYFVNAAGEPDWQQAQVRYYGATGNLLGMALQRPMTIYKEWDHPLAMGSDGAIYQLLSNPDHSVQIVRLGFSDSLPPVTVVPTVTPTLLNTLEPPSTPGATGEEKARSGLLAFFSNLSAGNYAEAATYFGGEVSVSIPTQAPDGTVADYWTTVCTQLRCLAVAGITDVVQVSESEYTFYVVFVNPDGTRFELSACCGGDPAANPPVWQFAFPVQKVEGVWKVMRAPVYVP